RALFLQLTSVSGVGPRVALSLLGAMLPGDLACAIVAGDTALLSRIPGVGKKTAARLCVELASKLDGFIAVGTGAAQLTDAELVEALVALGYTTREAVDAAHRVGGSEDVPLEQRIRRALQMLATR
ncbi:MAG: Holliday junction branch migration protein RuvA, partial [Dehalococcoidia bacterium]|nr:Holliday junction branch migration protein RuvA [Dehalococcoidia bacterium]